VADQTVKEETVGSITPSPRFSFTGYSAPTWLAKNAEALKAIGVAVAGLATYFVAKIQPPEFGVVISGIVASVVKFLLDALDYWLSANSA
jgi:hypothetical protein